MTDMEFRDRLSALGFNQSTFARRLIGLGDPRSFDTLLRSISNLARGATSVPGEMIVILNLFDRYPAIRGTPDVRKAGRPRRDDAADMPRV